MICAECKREVAEGTQTCPVCRAPANSQPWVKAEPQNGLADDVLKLNPSSSMAANQAPAWEALAAATRSRRASLVVAVVLLSASVAMILGIWLAYSSWKHRPGAWTRQLTFTRLRPGDCLTGSNLGLGTGSAWPDTVTAVPCTQWHLAEVMFAGNLWPASAAYPGDIPMGNTVNYRCLSALYAYAGRSNPSLSYDSVAPSGGSDWASGDREVVCLAYEPGVALLHSVKATHR